MSHSITQRQLRNDSGEIMRRLDAGESFVVTRRGVAVGELIPVRRRTFANRDRVLDVFAGAPPVDRHRLLADLDELVDQDPAPRG